MPSKLQELFHQALDLSEAERARFVDAQLRLDRARGEHLARLLELEGSGHAALAALDAAPDDGPVRVSLPGLLPEGLRLGAYRIGPLIGAGGMGRVYRARRCDGQIEQTVAIKLVRPDRLEPAVLGRFSSERRLLASLRHPGICAFLDAGTTEDGSPFVVMEYVQGEALLDHCDRHRLGLRARLRLLRQILAAVAHAHARLVVHRDLKPGNVLVTPEGEAKLLDFGIGKSLAETDATATATLDRFLTPQNAAPELLRGEPTGVACDVYALGVLAYELLCGQPPFALDGLRGPEIERLVQSVPPVPMSQRVSDPAAHARGATEAPALARQLRGDLDAIVARCLRKAPEDRYPGVNELDEDIARHLDRRPIRVRRGDRLYRLGRFFDRHRLAAALTGALILSVLAGGLGLLVQSFELTRQRNLAVIERDHAQQVVEVLREAFLAADPARVAGADVRVRDVFEAARPRVLALAEDQPHLFAVLADTVAGVELALASDAHAAELAQRGLAAAEAVGADPALIRRLRLTAARALVGLGNLELAQSLLDAVRTLDPAPQPDWAVAQARLDYDRSSDPDATIDLLRKALVAVRNRPPEDEVATEVHWQLADTLRLNRRYREAYEALNATLTWQLQRLPDNHPRVALTKLRRLNVSYRFEESEITLSDLELVVEQLREQYGPRSSIAGLAHSILGAALHSTGETETAVTQFRLAWQAWRDALGEGHANTLRIGLNLAITLAEHPNSIFEATEILGDVVNQSEQRLGPESPLSTHARVNLARILGLQDRWREAVLLMGSESAARGDRVGSTLSRRSQADILPSVLAGAGCPQPADAELAAACAAAQDLLDRLLALED